MKLRILIKRLNIQKVISSKSLKYSISNVFFEFVANVNTKYALCHCNFEIVQKSIYNAYNLAKRW